jgi:predicted PurR-regulated permease PerM
LTVLLTVIIVIVPVVLFLGVLVKEAAEVSSGMNSWVEDHVSKKGGLEQAMEQIPFLRGLIPYQDQIVEKAGQLAGRTASFVGQMLLGATQGTAQFFLMLFVALYAMFYFLKDGRKIIDWGFAYTPLSKEDRQRLVLTFVSVSRAILKSTVVIGIVQGGLAGAAFAVAGISGAVFWAALMALLSILPGLGTAIVWVPAVFYLAIIGQYGTAIGLALWCALVVGTADNVLRPLLVGRETELPDLLVFLTTLGGIFLFGAAGLIVGPVVGALFIAIWSLWGSAMEKIQAAVPSEAMQEP